MATFGNTELTATKMEVISERVQRQLISESVMAGALIDLSAFARKGAESVSFPKGGDFTVNQRASGALAVQQVFNYDKDNMPLSFRSSISWVVDPFDEIESVIAVQSDLIGRATRGHAVDVDINAIAELETVGVAITTVSPAITDPVIREMRSDLIRRKARARDLVLAVSPEQESEMLGINKFTLVQDYGSEVVRTGQLGTIYGMPVLMTPELADGQYFMFERSGCGIAFQRAPMLDSRKAPEYGAGAQLYTLDQKYGIKGLQLGEQGVLATESPLVSKDNNL